MSGPAGKTKILIVQTAFPGDVVLTTPLIRAAAEFRPEAEVHFLGIPETIDLLRHNPHLDKVWAIAKRGGDRGVTGLVRWLRRLAAERYELALVPHRSLRSALLVWGAGIGRRVGLTGGRGGRL